MKMLVDGEWLERQIKSEPDAEVEAGGATFFGLPVVVDPDQEEPVRLAKEDIIKRTKDEDLNPEWLRGSK